jgi:hypothetical protein
MKEVGIGLIPVNGQALGSTINAGNLEIEWKVIDPANNKERVYGTSKNRMYVTGIAAPAAFHTVVAIGSEQAKGLAPTGTDGPEDEAITNAIWREFSDRVVPRVEDGGPERGMQYWKSKGSNVIQATHDLLSIGEGSCGAWARFMRDVLSAQGVDADVVLIEPAASVKPTALTDGRGIPESYLVTATGKMQIKPLQGQGGTPDQRQFTNHAVVRLNNTPTATIWDPSYGGEPVVWQGVPYVTPERAWEIASVDAYEWMAEFLSVLGDRPPAGFLDTYSICRMRLDSDPSQVTFRVPHGE